MDDKLLQKARQALVDAAYVCPHTDADGLAAGAIALRLRGESANDALLLGRGVNPWHDGVLPDGYPAVLDQGIRKLDRPMLIVDHHAPEAKPQKDQIYIGGHGEPSGVSTSVLMRRVVPDCPPWLAAVGAAGDYGDDGLKQPECIGEGKDDKVVKTHVKKLVSLVNAPRRTPRIEPVRVALSLLVEAESPKAALADKRIEELDACKQEYRAEFDRCMKTAPQVGDEVALIRFSSDYQVHPLVAQTWLRRLSPKIVISANDGYTAGNTHFACRGGPDDVDLRAFLKSKLPDAQGEFAHGHTKATGGSIPHAEFDRLVKALEL